MDERKSVTENEFLPHFHPGRSERAGLPLKAYSGGLAPGGRDLPHFHEEVEILAIERGAVSCCAGGAEARCGAGDVVAFNPGEIHSVAAEDGASYTGILFRYESLEPKLPDECHTKYVTPFQRGDFRLPFLAAGESRVRLFAEARFIAETHEAKAPGHELLLKASLYRLLAFYASGAPFFKEDVYTGKYPADPSSPLNRVLEYMNCYFGQKIYVKQLADIANMNKNYFCEYFKANMKVTPVEYLNILRIGEAKKMIDCSERKLIDIAYEVGFNNFSYFTQTFHSIAGILPSQYRKTRNKIAY